jgi:hypothetical protein
MPYIAIAVVLFILTLVFSVRFQTLVVLALTIGGTAVQGTWTRVSGIAMRVARFSFVALIILWIVNFIFFLTVGLKVNSPISGLILGIFVPAWSMLYIISKIFVVSEATAGGMVHRFMACTGGVMHRLMSGPYLISKLFVFLALPFFIFGVWSPEVKGSADRWSGNKKSSFANWFDKKSVQSEKESGIFGIVTEATRAHNAQKLPVFAVPSGTLIKVANLKGIPATEDAEGMIKVMLPNKHGIYLEGNSGYIPSRLIDWDYKGYKAEREAEKKAEAEKQKAEKHAAKAEAKARANTKTVKVQYDNWNPNTKGAVSLGTFPSGTYLVSVDGSFSKKGLKDPKLIDANGSSAWRNMPEGIRMMHPMPAGTPGSRIVRIGDGPWKQVSAGTKLYVPRDSEVFITINIPQTPAEFGPQVQGYDDVTIKRISA